MNETEELVEKVKRVFWDFAIRQVERENLITLNESEAKDENSRKTAMLGAGR